MTLYSLVLFVAAAVAFAGVCCRLAHMEHAYGSLRWHGILIAHVLLGMGLLARLLHMQAPAAMLITVGLALFFATERRELPR